MWVVTGLIVGVQKACSTPPIGHLTTYFGPWFQWSLLVKALEDALHVYSGTCNPSTCTCHGFTGVTQGVVVSRTSHVVALLYKFASRCAWSLLIATVRPMPTTSCRCEKNYLPRLVHALLVSYLSRNCTTGSRTYSYSWTGEDVYSVLWPINCSYCPLGLDLFPLFFTPIQANQTAGSSCFWNGCHPLSGENQFCLKLASRFSAGIWVFARTG